MEAAGHMLTQNKPTTPNAPSLNDLQSVVPTLANFMRVHRSGNTFYLEFDTVQKNFEL